MGIIGPPRTRRQYLSWGEDKAQNTFNEHCDAPFFHAYHFVWGQIPPALLGLGVSHHRRRIGRLSARSRIVGAELDEYRCTYLPALALSQR